MDPLPPPPPEPPPIPSNVQQQQQQQQPPQPTSILERLRERVSRELMPDPVEEMQRRARTWAAGIGSVRGGTLFEGLAAGQQAVDRQRQQEEQARAGRLQQMEQEALRQAEQNLREREFEYNQSPNPQNQLRLAQARQIYAEIAQGRRRNTVQLLDLQGNVVLVDAETGQEIRNTGLRSPQTSRLNVNAENTLRQNAANRAQIAVDNEARRRTLLGQTMSAEERAQMRVNEERRNLESVGLLPLPQGSETSTQTAPRAPDQTLRYGGPQPQPRQQ